MKTDTIAAIATAVSDSGIGIIRISGDEAVEIADKVYRSRSGKKRLVNVESHTIHYGYIYDRDELIDEVMVAVMKAPNTYTKEDTVEIDCHGGVLVMTKILETVVRNGCRLAEPGEFTKRAFLNGRIDLSKAEAVMDLIQSKNEFALKASVNQLKGSVSDKVRSLRDDILYEIAFIESALDDPEHISLDGYREKLEQKTLSVKADLKKLIDSADNGKLLKDGINTVIVGKPNVGKSSFLNLLVGEERAIVTNVAGTTRDTLEEFVKLNGIGLNIIDTAGIRDTDDEVEKIGVEKARRYANNADLIIYMTDVSQKLDENDAEIVELIADKKMIVLLNKTDLEQVVSDDEIYEFVHKKMTRMSENNALRVIKTSTKENIGMDAFEDAIKEMFFGGEIAVNDEIYITSERHKEALLEAYESMDFVLRSLADDMPEDFYSIDLMNAYASLGRIIGEEIGDDLVNEIFRKFCMGK
ncbi:MAG: tRNA uridine-5-carboxymethylaminomethyl(34) synthesis GTPase MnmE [Lachnospiraceae bacterium]|nr:tRNA uridine-5-carboxymethylaminomethyl(34) synthesis GTPase MnmE [Lachnospiraceae bacterium]